MSTIAAVSLFAPASYEETDLIAASRRAWCGSIYVFDLAGRESRMVSRMHTRKLAESETSMNIALKEIQEALAGGSTDKSAPSERLLVIGAINSDGFDVHLFVSGENIVGDFGGLVHDFDDLGSAMAWVKKAMSGSYRLHIVQARGVPREWKLEPATSGADPNDVLACGQWIWLERMRDTKHVFRQNKHIE
jgi:hypothetical protein